MFDVEKVTTSATAWGQDALDRCGSLARSAWSGLRGSRLPAEAIIGLAASPGGYDTAIDGATRAAQLVGRITGRAARAIHRGAVTASTAVAVGIARIDLPSGLAATQAVAAAQTAVAAFGSQLADQARQAARRIGQAATTPSVRQATTTAASIARTVVTVDRVTGGASLCARRRSWAATRTPNCGSAMETMLIVMSPSTGWGDSAINTLVSRMDNISEARGRRAPERRTRDVPHPIRYPWGFRRPAGCAPRLSTAPRGWG